MGNQRPLRHAAVHTPLTRASQVDMALAIYHLRARVADWARLWQIPKLQEKIIIELSQRLRRSLGLARPAAGLIRLNPVLLQDANRDLLEETLCHEAAHVAVHEYHGPNCRAHGPEWRALMVAAGFRPRVKVPADEVNGLWIRTKSPVYQYEHHCPVCRTIYMARHTDRRWRCAFCVQVGREGRLVVTRRRAT